MAVALKLIRYKHQFGLTVPEPQHWVKEVMNATLDESSKQRIELYVLDALFTAKELAIVLPDVQAVLNKMPGSAGFGPFQDRNESVCNPYSGGINTCDRYTRHAPRSGQHGTRSSLTRFPPQTS
jgi:hypothetical protein